MWQPEWAHYNMSVHVQWIVINVVFLIKVSYYILFSLLIMITVKERKMKSGNLLFYPGNSLY